ncbi:MAG: 30S ribosome-binding factor RbfA [Longimicrobiales bacterium]|jgi:ribosome-binding factor A|tara:strand:- start:258 stop:644 length:387 start_codon:yes stop_codon:yes gene_type:complete
MSNQRLTRLNEQFRREIMEILVRDVRDPRIQDVVVTGVEVTSDLWMAKVYVQASGTRKNKAEALEGLEAAQGFIRRSLANVMRIRRTPELRFLEDKTFTYVQNIEEVLEEIRLEDSGPRVSTSEDNEE